MPTQCSLDLESLQELSLRCVWVDSQCVTVRTSCGDANKDLCEKEEATVGEDNTTLKCLWLYSGSEGEDGMCVADDSLDCESVVREVQCVGEKIGNECVWLKNDSLSMGGQCRNKVCFSSLVYFKLFF
jgi:hypothetical protein